MTIFKLYHIKPISGRRIISVLDWSRNFILAKLISDIFRSINRTHAHRNGIWTTHCQHYIAAFTWTSWRWKITKLKIKCMLTPNMLRKNGEKNGGSSISTSSHYILQRMRMGQPTITINDAACKLQCFNWFKHQVNGKFSDHLYFLVLWHLSLCLMHVSIRFHSSKLPPDI